MPQILRPIIICLAALLLAGCRDQERNAELLAELDRAIEEAPRYDQAKMHRVDSLRHLLSVVDTPSARFELNNQIFEEYRSFVCDSAMHYINANIAIAQLTGDQEQLAQSYIEKADLVAKAGLFAEAVQMLEAVDSSKLPDCLRDNYLQTCLTTYQYMVEYGEGSEYVAGYSEKIAAYRDSLLQMPGIDPFIYDTEYGSWLISNGRKEEAVEFFGKSVDKYTPGTREYSVMISLLAYSYEITGNRDCHEHYIALSAISDVKGSVKENLALRALAKLRFEQGDVPRAYNYLKKSMTDANYFSARMRKNQAANMLPLVTQSYEAMQAQLQSKLKIYIAVISALAVGLIVAILLIIEQLKTVSRSLQLVSTTKDKLERLNDELKQANTALTHTNTALTESSCIKEEYIGKFMGLCSNYISTLEQYRKNLHQLAASGRIEEMHKTLRSTSIVNTTLKEFYTAFDTAFLNIFPDFVARFNELLPEADQIQLREGERLNTELRVFALIRLGIADSAKIASFLRCSITTVYTYRSKRKNRALRPADFDNEVMKIASF